MGLTRIAAIIGAIGCGAALDPGVGSSESGGGSDFETGMTPSPTAGDGGPTISDGGTLSEAWLSTDGTRGTLGTDATGGSRSDVTGSVDATRLTMIGHA